LHVRSFNQQFTPVRPGAGSESEAGRSEWLALFREDIEQAFSLESIEQCVIPGRTELLPAQSLSYLAFVDPSGGRRDSFTACVAHRQGDKAVIDLVRAWKPPFDPSEVVKECAEALRPYRVRTLVGDNYGGEWPVAEFRKHGVTYQLADKNRSQLYLAMIPVINSKRVELPDDRRMIDELRRLERRRGRSGRDSVDHPAYGGSDDIANAVAGAVNLVISKPPMSMHAVPIGVGRSMFAGVADAMLQPLSDRPLSAEERPNTGCAVLIRSPFTYGDGVYDDDENGGYVSQTGRRRKFPSMD
jgi:hypothetical protein